VLWIRIRFIALMRILIFYADPDPDYFFLCGYGFLSDTDADLDPGYQNDADPCGSGSSSR
jgi:hypothetical protein